MSKLWPWVLMNALILAATSAGAALARRFYPDDSPEPWAWFLAAAGLLALGNAAVFGMAWLRLVKWLRLLTDDLAQAEADPARPIPAEAPYPLDELSARIEVLRKRHAHALEELDRRGEELRQLQARAAARVGRADAERGQPRSGLRSRSASAGGMVGRLTGELCWMIATTPLQRFLGRAMDSLADRPILELVHPEDAATLQKAFQEVRDKGEGHNILVRIFDQERKEHYVEVDAVARYDAQGGVLHYRCHFLDVTARILADRELRRRTEELERVNERLRRSNRQLERLKEGYRDLYHHSPVMYFSLDGEGRFLSCNETMVATLGFSREELLGRSFTDIVPAERHGARFDDPAWHQPHQELTLATQFVKKDGQVIDVEVRSLAVHDSKGRFLRTRSVAQDTTAQNQLALQLRQRAEELKKANEKLTAINRELDEFTHVVSHDLKEPLRTIEGFSALMAEDYRDQLGPQAQETLSHLAQASRRMKALIDDLLTLSRAGRVTNVLRLCRLEEELKLVLRDLADLLQRKEGTVRVEGELPAVLADPSRVNQLLANLISNALKYNQSARPEVVLSCREESADWVTFAVRDNGIGIDAKHHEQIFRVFRRVHRGGEYEGTGAGLAICKKIVEAHGGRIWVESSPGQGSTFYFTLRKATPELLAQAAARADEGSPTVPA